VVGLTWVMLLLGSSPSARAYDVADWLSVGGIFAAGGQCQLVSGDSGVGDKCRVGLPVQTEVSVRPTESDEVFVKLGFAISDGLNEASQFAISPWAADLHDDVKALRVHHLLNAWYKHRFAIGNETTLSVTGGVIDATDYLDDNAYANDEYTQFMNEALVNSPNGFLPSYDLGGALELDIGRWSARGVVMRVDENDDGDDFTFWGAQLGYRAENRWGEGNCRVFVANATRDFLDPTGTSKEKPFAVGLSFDQQLGETFGAFLRLAWQDDDAAIAYDSLYSSGINVRGGAWGRSDDEIGLAYGFLDGGNQDLRGSQVAEVYYRLALSEHFALTADAQYLRETVKSADDPHGFVLGLRATFEF
jgi:porin